MMGRMQIVGPAKWRSKDSSPGSGRVTSRLSGRKYSRHKVMARMHRWGRFQWFLEINGVDDVAPDADGAHAAGKEYVKCGRRGTPGAAGK